MLAINDICVSASRMLRDRLTRRYRRANISCLRIIQADFESHAFPKVKYSRDSRSIRNYAILFSRDDESAPFIRDKWRKKERRNRAAVYDKYLPSITYYSILLLGSILGRAEKRRSAREKRNIRLDGEKSRGKQ